MLIWRNLLPLVVVAVLVAAFTVGVEVVTGAV